MAGLLGLVGGDEFRSSCVEMDGAVVERIGGASSRVLVLPTAAAGERPELAAANGVNHFTRIGADAAPLMVVDGATANEQQFADELGGASLLYIAGGNPGYLLDALRDSLVWSAIRDAWQNGMGLVGSSAGAMVLAQWMRRPPDAWGEGLNAAPGLVVLPHHERASEERTRSVRERMDGRGAVLGIDGATGCFTDGEGAWEVLGEGNVTVYLPGEEAQRFRTGETFSI